MKKLILILIVLLGGCTLVLVKVNTGEEKGIEVKKRNIEPDSTQTKSK